MKQEIPSCLVPVLLCSMLIAALQPPAAEAERRVVAPSAAVLDLPFSPAVWNGDLLMLSGAIANRPGTTEVEGNAFVQTRTTLDNLKTVLHAAGLDFSDVVDVNVYLADSRHFAPFNKIYHQGLQAPRPSRTVMRADIAIPGALTEISMIALRRGVERRAITPEGWPEIEAFSWGTLAGDTLFISGMVSNDPATSRRVPGDPKAQVQQSMANVGKVLKAAGMGYDNLVSCRVYLDDARSFAAFNEVYPTFFKQAPPARATVRAGLIDAEMHVELQCTAVQGERRAVMPDGATPRKTLSPAIRVGERLFLSGMVGRTAQGVFPPGPTAQTEVVLANLRATLAAAGMTFDDVTDATVYLSDIRFYDAMNAVYAKTLGRPAPARATVGTVLMTPDALVEIQMHARQSVENGTAGH